MGKYNNRLFVVFGVISIVVVSLFLIPILIAPIDPKDAEYKIQISVILSEGNTVDIDTIMCYFAYTSPVEHLVQISESNDTLVFLSESTYGYEDIVSITVSMTYTWYIGVIPLRRSVDYGPFDMPIWNIFDDVVSDDFDIYDQVLLIGIFFHVVRA